jgi:hypothetical protein
VTIECFCRIDFRNGTTLRAKPQRITVIQWDGASSGSPRRGGRQFDKMQAPIVNVETPRSAITRSTTAPCGQRQSALGDQFGRPVARNVLDRNHDPLRTAEVCETHSRHNRTVYASVTPVPLRRRETTRSTDLTGGRAVGYSDFLGFQRRPSEVLRDDDQAVTTRDGVQLRSDPGRPVSDRGHYSRVVPAVIPSHRRERSNR